MEQPQHECAESVKYRSTHMLRLALLILNHARQREERKRSRPPRCDNRESALDAARGGWCLPDPNASAESACRVVSVTESTWRRMLVSIMVSVPTEGEQMHQLISRTVRIRVKYREVLYTERQRCDLLHQALIRPDVTLCILSSIVYIYVDLVFKLKYTAQ